MQSNLPKWWLFVVMGCLLPVTLGSTEEQQTFDHDIVDKLLQSKLELVPESPAFEAWRTPTEHWFEFFLFNWTNVADFPAVKPHFKELGPYRFRHRREHVNVTWNQTEHTLGYNVLKKWVFDEASSRSLDENVTTVDFITALMVHLGRYDQSDYDKTMNAVYLHYSGHGVSTTRTARELLFEGYHDGVLALAQSAPGSERMGLFDKFGWFYHQNNTLVPDDVMEVTTGEDGSLPGQMVRWMQKDHIKFYEKSCAKLAGSAGEFFPHNLTKESELKVFVEELCRTVAMPYMSSGVFNGLNYHKYGIAPSSFDKAQNTNCFCNGTCEWAGVMNTSACGAGSPLFVSLPHFLHGDPRLGEQITGLSPDPEKHSFYYAIEPRTGIPLDVVTRYQMNVYMEGDNKSDSEFEASSVVSAAAPTKKVSKKPSKRRTGAGKHTGHIALSRFPSRFGGWRIEAQSYLTTS